MKSSQMYFLAVFAVLTYCSVALASTEPATSYADAEKLSHRSEKKLGGYLGLLGDPAPTLVGLNVAYNLTDYMRASVGFGRVSTGATIQMQGSEIQTEESSMTTIGLGTKFMMPGWSLTPVLGLGYSHVFMSGMESSDFKANNLYMTVGADWQTKGGFNLGLGLNKGLTSGAPTAPYVNLGWFFDIAG